VEDALGAGQVLHLPWVQLSNNDAQIPDNATAVVLGMVQSAMASATAVSATGLGEGFDRLPPAAGGDDAADQAAVEEGQRLPGGSWRPPTPASREELDDWLRRQLAAPLYDANDELETALGDSDGIEAAEDEAMGDFHDLFGNGFDDNADAELEELEENDEADESDCEPEQQYDDGGDDVEDWRGRLATAPLDEQAADEAGSGLRGGSGRPPPAATSDDGEDWMTTLARGRHDLNNGLGPLPALGLYLDDDMDTAASMFIDTVVALRGGSDHRQPPPAAASDDGEDLMMMALVRLRDDRNNGASTFSEVLSFSEAGGLDDDMQTAARMFIEAIISEEFDGRSWFD